MADRQDISIDLVQSLRLGLNSEVEGMRLFAARLVRKYRQTDPDLSRRIDDHLKTAPAASPMRRRTGIEPGAINWMTAGAGIVHSEQAPPGRDAATRPLHGRAT